MNKKHVLINKKMIKQTLDQNNKNKRVLIKTHLTKKRFFNQTNKKTLFDQTTFDQNNF